MTSIVTTLVAYADAESGIASSTLVRTFAPMTAGVCGAFDPVSAVTVSGTGVVSGLADGCHRFTLTGTDLAGNASSVFTTVRLDASAPTSGSIIGRRVCRAAAAGAMAYARVNPVVVAWTKFSDPESGITVGTCRSHDQRIAGRTVSAERSRVAANVTATLTPLAGTSNQTLSTTRAALPPVRAHRHELPRRRPRP